MPNLTTDPGIIQITDEIRQKAKDGHYVISDVICHKDGQEYQFVDVVMEGGRHFRCRAGGLYTCT